MSKKGEKPIIYIYDRTSAQYFQRTIIVDPEGLQKVNYLPIKDNYFRLIEPNDIGKIPQFITYIEFLENNGGKDVSIIEDSSE